MNILSTTFCGISFENPFVLASGYVGVTGAGNGRCCRTRWEVSPQNRGGRMRTKDIQILLLLLTNTSFLNAVGLPDAGIEKSREEIKRIRSRTKAPITSIVAPSLKNMEKLHASQSRTCSRYDRSEYFVPKCKRRISGSFFLKCKISRSYYEIGQGRKR